MKRHCLAACWVLGLSIGLFGIVYPVLLWIGAQVIPVPALTIHVHNGPMVGLWPVGQPLQADMYFQSRPASQLHTSLPLAQRRLLSDIHTQSASGCDPEISWKSALEQVARVAHARAIDEAQVLTILHACEQPTYFGLFPRRVHLLTLNSLLDETYPISAK